MGICSSKKGNTNINYKEEKGINEKHEHMLVYCEPFMRINPDNFVCFCCKKTFYKTGSFHCVSCNFNICRECFSYTGGIIYNKITEGKKGVINTHPNHQLIYSKSKSKGIKDIKLNCNNLYMCNKCNCYFLIDYINCWTCSRCEFNLCDKCFKNNNGKEIK